MDTQRAAGPSGLFSDRAVSVQEGLRRLVAASECACEYACVLQLYIARSWIPRDIWYLQFEILSLELTPNQFAGS